MELNKQQKEAVEHMDGPCLVTSCPGSGKSTVLVERTIRLIEKGIDPKNILCLTFTNKAGDNMKKRIWDRLGYKPNFFIGTFHSFCAKLIRKIGVPKYYDYNYTILDDYDQNSMVLKISRSLGYDIKIKDAQRISHALNYYRDLLEDFSWVENHLKSEEHIEIAKKYVEECRKNNMIDFCGLIYEAIRIIKENENIKEQIQDHFKYILIDECHDTSFLQFEFLYLISGKWDNLMAISDPDQSIFRWRNARYENIQNFINKYENCRVIHLTKNYRSTPQIVKVADRLIKYNFGRMEKKFETDNEDGEQVRCYSFKDQTSEAEWIAKTIKDLIEIKNVNPSEIAVIYRINRLSEEVERALNKKGVPYKVVGSRSFYDRKEIRDCLNFLSLLSNSKNSIAFHRTANLFKGMGNVTIGKVENKSSEDNISLFDACLLIKEESKSANIKEVCQLLYDIYKKESWDFSNPAECLNKLVEKLNYFNYLEEEYDDYEERKENVKQLIDSCTAFNNLSEFLQNVSLITRLDDETGKEKQKVSLLSGHSAKGLEFEVVFNIGEIQDLVIPHKLACMEDPNEGIREERNIQYVMMTRAKKLLILTYPRTVRKFNSFQKMIYQKCVPSQFLFEAGLLKEN